MADQQWIDDMRAMLDFLESHPRTLRALYPSSNSLFYVFETHADEFRTTLKEFGGGTKSASFGYARVQRTFGSVALQLYTASLCEKVQVGTETVHKTVETAETEEVPVYEWRCPESFLAPATDSTPVQISQ